MKPLELRHEDRHGTWEVGPRWWLFLTARSVPVADGPALEVPPFAPSIRSIPHLILPSPPTTALPPAQSPQRWPDGHGGPVEGAEGFPHTLGFPASSRTSPMDHPVGARGAPTKKLSLRGHANRPPEVHLLSNPHPAAAAATTTTRTTSFPAIHPSAPGETRTLHQRGPINQTPRKHCSIVAIISIPASGVACPSFHRDPALPAIPVGPPCESFARLSPGYRPGVHQTPTSFGTDAVRLPHWSLIPPWSAPPSCPAIHANPFS